MEIIIKDSLRESVEKASEGRQTIVRTNKGYPSYFNVINSFKCESISDSLIGANEYVTLFNSVDDECRVYASSHAVAD